MEIRRSMFCLALVLLAVSQCSDHIPNASSSSFKIQENSSVMPDAVQFSSKLPSAGGPTSEVSNVQLDADVTSHNICDVSEGLDTSSSAAEAEECDADTLGYESSDSDSEIHSRNIKDQIQQWALKYQIPQNALKELLTILRDNSNTDFKKFLPKDSRSLLKTPKFNNIVPMGNGKYWYNGIENCLKEVLSQMISELPTCIFLSFNIDGLPVANSTKNEFWPILCKIDGMDVAPLVIAIFFGSTKPCLELFLRPFVNELIKLLQGGLLIQRQIVPIKIRCFICDTPARCFIKESHSMHRRQAVDDVNYDDPLLGDEATDDEALNDTDNAEAQPEKAPAVIETKPTHYEVEAGGDIRLECKVSPENTVVQWYKGNQLYFIGNINLHPEEVRYSIAEDSKDLLIKSAELSDSDVFKCETVQKALMAINHTLLITQKPVIINMSASHGGNLAVGSDLKLTCLVTASPVPTVIWSVTRKDNNQNDRLTEKDGEFSVDGGVYSMFIKNIKKSDAGQYYCYALNKLGSHQAEITVVVNGKPQVHVPRPIVNSGLNTEAILQCSAHEEARPHIRWYKDGSLVENIASKYMISTRGSHSNLTVFPNADEDFGTYTCEAANSFGRHNKSIDLVQSPVVEDLEVDGSSMSWVVHSHQPLEAMEVQLKPLTEDGDWRVLEVPLPQSSGHKYEISYLLEDKQLDSGEYHAIVKVKNSKSWGGSNEPAVVKIENAQPQYIQHASVFRENNAAHSLRPVYTAFTTILMYLLVRMA